MANIWKIAPGKNAAVWRECLDGKCTSINWLNRNDLSSYETIESVEKQLLKSNEGKSGSARSIWSFVNEVEIGDTIVANDGKITAVGVGLVKSKYLPPTHRRNPNGGLSYHRHTRLVDWKIVEEVSLGEPVFNIPTVQLLNDSHTDLIKRAYLHEHPQLRTILVQLFAGRLPDDDAATKKSAFIPTDEDLRRVVERQIKQRRGQQAFRNKLRNRYGDRCVVTGCSVVSVLEAAHIHPYLGEKDNDPSNGLLLRADIHTLFDLNLIGIEPQSLKIVLVAELQSSSEYRQLDGKKLGCKKNAIPSDQAIQKRFTKFQETNQL